MRIDEIYLIITIISCVVSIMSACFAVIPFFLLIKMAQKYQDILASVVELTQDIRQTTHHVATVVHNFTELVNNKNSP